MICVKTCWQRVLAITTSGDMVKVLVVTAVLLLQPVIQANALDVEALLEPQQSTYQDVKDWIYAIPIPACQSERVFPKICNFGYWLTGNTDAPKHDAIIDGGIYLVLGARWIRYVITASISYNLTHQWELSIATGYRFL